MSDPFLGICKVAFSSKNIFITKSFFKEFLKKKNNSSQVRQILPDCGKGLYKTEKEVEKQNNRTAREKNKKIT